MSTVQSICVGQCASKTKHLQKCKVYSSVLVSCFCSVERASLILECCILRYAFIKSSANWWGGTWTDNFPMCLMLMCHLGPCSFFLQARLFDEPQLASLCLETIDKSTGDAINAEGFTDIDLGMHQYGLLFTQEHIPMIYSGWYTGTYPNDIQWMIYRNISQWYTVEPPIDL